MRLAVPPALRMPRGLTLIVATFVAAVAMVLGLGVAGASATSATPAPPAEGAQFTVGGIIQAGPGNPIEGAEVLVEGNGIEETGVTGADGRWSVALPGPGEYTATLDPDSLPEGIEPTQPDNLTRQVNASTTSTINLLFPVGEEGAAPVVRDEGALLADRIWTQVVNGIIFGLFLALAAIGISLIFGTTGLNNFAHGEMVTFGAIVFWFLSAAFREMAFPLNVILAGVITLVASGAFGWAQDAGIHKPLRSRGVKLVQAMIVTIGLSLAVRYVFVIIFGTGDQTLNVGFSGAVDIGAARVSWTSVASAIISAVILVLVGLFLTRTRIGKATRAVSDNASLAAASGINVDRIIRIVWVLAGTLTGLSGVLYGLYRGVSWDMGFQILLLLFAAVTLGGLGSAFGALVGALFIGLATEVSAVWLPNDLRYAIALVILILVLLVRPQGFLGRKERIG
ncbi:branched-chain amino acid ABC transporter permease [Herbiconiux sp. SYSU D00978]|uniref:branched-chain amino acid ABC transporter permease n=1 Tax=Herbiconiux sp. SYSU D00978 TaxID=2812562 RepID=UPI0027DD8A4E|nr:branched-chain amino acid ABC transporter permease [Herbiconiux sp. SYSU D00978]